MGLVAVKNKIMRFLQKRPTLALCVLRNWRAAFYNEAKVVLSAGIARSNSDSKEHMLRLRVHSLEKGLIMRPLRPVFAKSYIVETVELFAERFKQHQGLDCYDELLNWANSVLAEYFRVTGSDSEIDKARQAYEKLNETEHGLDGHHIPFVRPVEPLAIKYDDLLELAERRRSVRHVLEKQVEWEVLEKAMMVARQSPSACNRQGYKFHVIQDRSLIERVADLYGDYGSLQKGFPSLIVITGRMEAYGLGERHATYIDASLAAMSFQYALEVQGVGSCCIMWMENRERDEAIRPLLGLSDTEHPVIFMGVGYPVDTHPVPKSTKKSVDQLLRRVGESPAEADV